MKVTIPGTPGTRFVYLNVSVERASFRENLSTMRTNNPVNPVFDPDVGVEVGEGIFVAAERTTLWRRH
jgi:hypothetical protein